MKEERSKCWQTFSNVFFCFMIARSRKEKKDSGGECVSDRINERERERQRGREKGRERERESETARSSERERQRDREIEGEGESASY